MESRYLPYGRHSIDEEDIAAVVEVLRGDWLTTGPTVTRFEQAVCELTHAQEVVACSNGTTALHLALLGIGIGPGDLVIVPSITFIATANAARYVGADVVFADVDPNTGMMTPETLEQAIMQCPRKSQLRAAIQVHLAGQCGLMKQLQEVARRHQLQLIEDAAHAIGSSYVEDTVQYPVGSCRYSDAVTFSFHPVKTIAAGEGGAVTFANSEYASRARTLRNHGIRRDLKDWKADENGQLEDIKPWYYEVQELGYNYRLSDIQCALGLSQLKKLQAFIDQRARMVAYYAQGFTASPLVSSLEMLETSKTAWHLYVVRIPFAKIGKSRGEVMKHLLEKHRIGSQVHYIPLYRQPYYQDKGNANSFPGAERYYAECLSLPLFIGLERAEQQRVIETLLTILTSG